MLNNETAKIKWAPKRLSILLIIIAVIFIGWIFLTKTSQPVLSIDDRSYRLEVVRSEAAQAKGLSGRASLANDAGMLFAYNDAQDRCFWMKSMQFSIDIIWLDSKKKITHIEKDLPPSTYPRTYCYKAQYVIELPAGTADKHLLKADDQLMF